MMKISNRIQNHKQYQNISQYIFYRIVIMLTIEANIFYFYVPFCQDQYLKIDSKLFICVYDIDKNH